MSKSEDDMNQLRMEMLHVCDALEGDNADFLIGLWDAFILANIRVRELEAEGFHLTQWAVTVEDEVTHTTVWRCYTEGDKGDSEDLDTIQALASSFPLGTRMEILERHE